MTLPARLFVTVAALLLFTTTAHAQKEGAVDGLTLRLLDASGRTIETAKTESDGAWSFKVPSQGEYSIVVEESEFDDARSEIAEKVPGAIFQTASVTRQSGPLVTIGWSMRDIAWVSCYEAPRDPATGLANGEKKYKAVQFIREFDKAVAIIECKQGGTISGTVSYTVRK